MKTPTHVAQDRSRTVTLYRCEYALTPRVADQPLSSRSVTNIAQPSASDDPASALLWDNDLFSLRKPGADLLVRARAHSTSGPVTALRTGVRVIGSHGSAGQTIERIHTALVVGDRMARLWPDGKVSFSEPLPFESLDLDWAHAYGGGDRQAAVAQLADMPGILALCEEMGVDEDFSHPRNPVGRGMLVDDNARQFREVRLPNIEREDDLLTPERLVLPTLEDWWRTPRPVGFDAIDLGWMPRCALAGFAPPHSAQPERLPEVMQGHIPSSHMGHLFDTLGAITPDPRWMQCAPPELVFPHLYGGETVTLYNMHPTQPEYTLTLPRAPRLGVQTRGHLVTAVAEAKTVLIDMKAERLTILWRADFDPITLEGPDTILGWSEWEDC